MVIQHRGRRTEPRTVIIIIMWLLQQKNLSFLEVSVFHPNAGCSHGLPVWFTFDFKILKTFKAHLHHMSLFTALVLLLLSLMWRRLFILLVLLWFSSFSLFLLYRFYSPYLILNRPLVFCLLVLASSQSGLLFVLLHCLVLILLNPEFSGFFSLPKQTPKKHAAQIKFLFLFLSFWFSPHCSTGWHLSTLP